MTTSPNPFAGQTVSGSAPATSPNPFAGQTVSGWASTTTAGSSASTSGPTAHSAHNMLKALLLELAFIVVATMLAGINDTWASAMVTLMLALLVLRGLFEVDVFAAFAGGLQLTR